MKELSITDLAMKFCDEWATEQGDRPDWMFVESLLKRVLNSEQAGATQYTIVDKHHLEYPGVRM